MNEADRDTSEQPGVEERRVEWRNEEERTPTARSEASERTLVAGRRAMDKYSDALAELAK